MKKERNAALDVMKGIGILAMIAGHTGISSGLVGFVFVWHMPLFFLVAGYFFRPQSVAEAWKKNFRTLLIPYLLTATAMFVLCAGYSALGRDRNITNAFVTVFVGAGSRGVPVWGEYTIGAIWFLPAMFWCRIIYNHISIRISDKYKCGGGNFSSFCIRHVYGKSYLYTYEFVARGRSHAFLLDWASDSRIGYPEAYVTDGNNGGDFTFAGISL